MPTGPWRIYMKTLLKSRGINFKIFEYIFMTDAGNISLVALRKETNGNSVTVTCKNVIFFNSRISVTGRGSVTRQT